MLSSGVRRVLVRWVRVEGGSRWTRGALGRVVRLGSVRWRWRGLVVGFRERMSSVFSCSSSENDRPIIAVTLELDSSGGDWPIEIVVCQLLCRKADGREAQGWENVSSVGDQKDPKVMSDPRYLYILAEPPKSNKTLDPYRLNVPSCSKQERHSLEPCIGSWISRQNPHRLWEIILGIRVVSEDIPSSLLQGI